MRGSAYVTLSRLYYMPPKWPISFADGNVAKEMLKTTLKINPEGIDTNNFYGEFLLRHNKPDDAARYFKRTTAARLALTRLMQTIT